jgi:hypothetical protein
MTADRKQVKFNTHLNISKYLAQLVDFKKCIWIEKSNKVTAQNV